MQVFNAHLLTTSKGSVQIPLDEKHSILLQVASLKDVKLYGLSEGKKVLLKAGQAIRLRFKTQGFHTLELKGTGETEFTYQIEERNMHDGEPLDDENPPAVPMPKAGNLLLEMRALIDNEAARTRTPILDPEDLPWAERYVIDDDDMDFEEEIHARSLASQQKPKVEDPEPPLPLTTPPQAGPEDAGEPAPDQTSVTKIAAE